MPVIRIGRREFAQPVSPPAPPPPPPGAHSTFAEGAERLGNLLGGFLAQKGQEARQERHRVMRATEAARALNAREADKQAREAVFQAVTDVDRETALDPAALGEYVDFLDRAYEEQLEQERSGISDRAAQAAFDERRGARLQSFRTGLAQVVESRMSHAALSAGIEDLEASESIDDWVARRAMFEEEILGNLEHLSDEQRKTMGAEVAGETLPGIIQTAFEQDPVGTAQQLLAKPEVARELSAAERRTLQGQARGVLAQREAQLERAERAEEIMARELNRMVADRFSDTVMARLGRVTPDDLAEQSFDTLMADRFAKLDESEQLLEAAAPHLEESKRIEYRERLKAARRSVRDLSVEYTIAANADRHGRVFYPGSVSKESLELYVRSTPEYRVLQEAKRQLLTLEEPGAAIGEIAQGYHDLIGRHAKRFGALPSVYVPEIEGMVRSGNPNLVAVAASIHSGLKRNFLSSNDGSRSAELFTALPDEISDFLDRFNQARETGLTAEQSMLAVREPVTSGRRAGGGGLADETVGQAVKDFWEQSLLPLAQDKWGAENMSPGMLRQLETAFRTALDPDRGLSFGQAGDHAIAMLSRSWTKLPNGKLTQNAPPQEVMIEAWRAARRHGISAPEDLDFHYAGVRHQTEGDPSSPLVKKWTVSRRSSEGEWIATALTVDNDPSGSPTGLYSEANEIALGARAILRDLAENRPRGAGRGIDASGRGTSIFSPRLAQPGLRDDERSELSDVRTQFLERAEAFLELYSVPAFSKVAEPAFHRLGAMRESVRSIRDLQLETGSDARALVNQILNLRDLMENEIERDRLRF